MEDCKRTITISENEFGIIQKAMNRLETHLKKCGNAALSKGEKTTSWAKGKEYLMQAEEIRDLEKRLADEFI